MNLLKKIYKKYLFELKNLNINLRIPKYSKNIKPSFHLFLLNIYFDRLKVDKDHFIRYLIKNKIYAQQHYIPIYKFKVYDKKYIFFKGSEKYFLNSVSIPIYVGLDEYKQKKVINTIKDYFIKKIQF